MNVNIEIGSKYFLDENLSMTRNQNLLTRLPLPEVTLLCVDTTNHVLALRALIHSIEQCKFGDAIFFTNYEIAAPCRVQRIPKLDNIASYSEFMLKHVAPFVQTQHALVIQWDGHVVNKECWRTEFLEFDYIGARWPWMRGKMDVGNGGFSLRSKKLLDVLASSTTTLRGSEPEDLYICQTRRADLIADHGIRFATADIADSFSIEHVEPKKLGFGFHGLFEMWRYFDNLEMQSVILTLTEDIVKSSAYAALMWRYAKRKETAMLRLMLDKISFVISDEKIDDHLCFVLGSKKNAQDIISSY